MTLDSTRPPYEKESTAETFRLMLDRLLAERPGARVADVGCGTGRHTLAAAAADLRADKATPVCE